MNEEPSPLQAGTKRSYSPNELLHGSLETPGVPRLLTAGSLTALLDGCELRYVKIGGLEVIRRLHVAVRDANWNTIPGELKQIEMHVESDRFTIKFDVWHQATPVDFRWHGQINGSPEGIIKFSMTGEAKANFRYNRIGFCLLHPPTESGGKSYRASAGASVVSQGRLPDFIAPQGLENGQYRALFTPFDNLSVEMPDQLSVNFAFSGDLFEMEDHRNWTDASFKTYCTPLARPFPFPAATGAKLTQSVTCSFSGTAPTARDKNSNTVLALGRNLGRKLPAIGLGLASHGRQLSLREAKALRSLQLDHLRVDLHLARSEWLPRLHQAMAESKALGCKLELALFVTAAAERELTNLAHQLPAPAGIARVLVFHESEECTTESWLRLARKILEPVIPGIVLAGGTNIYFCELNRNRSNIGAADAVAYSINPQIHAFDNRSVMENVLAQADTLRTARSFAENRPLVVTPVTFRRRFNASATELEKAPEPTELPSQIEPRQMSLFGAAWTAGSIKQLAESGAASVTYFETTGWLGVIESDHGSPLPDRFPSEPGLAFPLFHVFADLAEFKSGDLIACESNRPLSIQALALRTSTALVVLAANLTSDHQKITLSGLPPGKLNARVLDTSTALLAMRDPGKFRTTGDERNSTGGILEFELPPFATVRLIASPVSGK